mmetsp:Transcript_2158/g.5071  ORF Transcript_2158/g.5071 Transcript_2158/m.5071 type:complete len:228 (+) Transcript_2158:85-768(+)
MNLILLAFRALAIIIFFRKSFIICQSWLQVVTLAAISFAPMLGLLLGFVFTILFPDNDHVHGIPNFDCQDLINFVATWILVHCLQRFILEWKDLVADNADVHDLLRVSWILVPVLSLFQFVRNPNRLKNFLRPIRVALGPASILSAIIVGIVQAMTPGCGLLASIVGISCAVSSFTGGILLRPDNFEVLGLFVRQENLTAEHIRQYHAYCNVFAVLVCAVPMVLYYI